MKKKWLLLPTLLLFLCGCAKAPATGTTAPATQPVSVPVTTASPVTTVAPSADTTTPPAQTLQIGFLMRDESSNSRYEALFQALEQTGMELTVCYAQKDQSQQDSQAAQLTDQDLLIVDPVIPDATENLIETARRAQIPLLFLDHQPEQALLESYNKIAYIGYDVAAAGTKQAQLNASLPEGGDLNGDDVITCLMLRGPEDEIAAQAWTEAAKAALSQVQLLEVLTGDWSQASGNRLCALALSKYGRDIEVILCGNELMALGVVEAIEDGGWTTGQDVYVTPCGNNAQLQSLIRRNAVYGTVYQDTALWCERVVQTAQQLLDGQAVEPVIYLDYTVLIGNSTQNSVD